jgi:hypothetical protein
MKAKGWGVCRDYCGDHRQGGPYTFLRNEPTVFAAEMLYIIHATRYLCRLQRVFAGGFVLENEPTGRVFSGVFGRKVGVFSRTKPECRLRHLDLPMTACGIRTRPYTWRSRPVGGVVGSDKMRSCERSKIFFSCALRKFPSKLCHRMCGGKTLWQGNSHESLRS